MKSVYPHIITGVCKQSMSQPRLLLYPNVLKYFNKTLDFMQKKVLYVFKYCISGEEDTSEYLDEIGVSIDDWPPLYDELIEKCKQSEERVRAL